MSNKTFSITSDFKVKGVNEEENFIVIEGYANTTEKDRVGDIVLEEAWNKGGMVSYMSNPIVLAFHDHTKPIGVVTEHTVDNKGLKVVAKIFKAAGNVFDFVKDGMLRTFSVGFRVKDADYDEKSDLFVIKDLELLEISVVSVPANAGSVFSVKKAFDNDDAYTEFKKEFNMGKDVESVENEVKASDTTSTEDVIKALEEKLGEKLSAELANHVKKSSEDLTAAVELILEQKNKDKEKENMSDTKDTAQPVFTKDMVEDLLKAAEERISTKFEAENKSLSEALDGLRGDLTEKSAELETLQRNKMRFDDAPATRATAQEVDSAVLLSKALKRGIENTKFGKQLIEKAGVGPHLGSTTDTWEEEFSLRLESDIRERLIMEPMFRKIQMNAATMHIPVNPEAGYGEWIARTYPPLRSTDGASTGTAVDHEITDTSLTAHKLVAKEYLGDEEEEDSILPLMPIIRDAVMRRMAKAADVALLRADSGATAPDGSSTFPFNGVATIALDAGVQTTISIAAATPITVANLATVRRGLGVWGLNPSELVYVVSHDVYYDLLDDPDFRTIDVVGSQATILRGQIGTVNGSPVVVSGEFAAKANNAHAAVCLYAPNFIVGQLRNTRVETDRSVEDQRNVIVASRRMGFLDVISGKGASVLTWVT